MMPADSDPNFSYSWRPLPGSLPGQSARRDPLIPDTILTHMFEHKGAIFEEYEGDEYRNRLPKRKTPLRCEINAGFPEGHGLEIVEGFNWQFFCHCESLICFGTIVLVVSFMASWKKADNVSTAFTGGSFFFAAGQVGYIRAFTVPEMLELWRY